MGRGAPEKPDGGRRDDADRTDETQRDDEPPVDHGEAIERDAVDPDRQPTGRRAARYVPL
jgi:hypothetical protein